MIIYVFFGICPSYLGQDEQKHNTRLTGCRGGVRQRNLTALKAHMKETQINVMVKLTGLEKEKKTQSRANRRKGIITVRETVNETEQTNKREDQGTHSFFKEIKIDKPFAGMTKNESEVT